MSDDGISSSETDQELCEVCGDPIPDEYGKWDPKAPVYADGYVYHKECEDEIFEWSVGPDSERGKES